MRKILLFDKVAVQGSMVLNKTACGIDTAELGKLEETVADHKAPNMCGKCVAKQKDIHRYAALVE